MQACQLSMGGYRPWQPWTISAITFLTLTVLPLLKPTENESDAQPAKGNRSGRAKSGSAKT